MAVYPPPRVRTKDLLYISPGPSKSMFRNSRICSKTSVAALPPQSDVDSSTVCHVSEPESLGSKARKVSACPYLDLQSKSCTPQRHDG